MGCAGAPFLDNMIISAAQAVQLRVRLIKRMPGPAPALLQTLALSWGAAALLALRFDTLLDTGYSAGSVVLMLCGEACSRCPQLQPAWI